MPETTIVEYAQTRLQTWKELPFNEVDSLILSCLAYLRLPLAFEDRVALKDLYKAENFDAMFHNVYSAPRSQALFTALCASPRYRDIQVSRYIQDSSEVQEKQFSAVCFQLDDDLAYVAFRGTDATLVGWKEDFNMAFSFPVPSQLEAARYLTDALPALQGTVLVGGHSKGGNLAVFAATRQTGISRIQTVYSHDGPSFPQTAFSSQPFQALLPKIKKTVPQSSIIGMILEAQEAYTIVKSNRFSVWQHDPYSWLVEGERFVTLSHQTPGALYMNTAINAWLTHISRQERERFFTTLYALLASDHAKTSAQWRKSLPQNLPAILQATKELSPDTKHFLVHTLKEMAALSLRSVPEAINPPFEK